MTETPHFGSDFLPGYARFRSDPQKKIDRFTVQLPNGAVSIMDHADAMLTGTIAGPDNTERMGIFVSGVVDEVRFGLVFTPDIERLRDFAASFLALADRAEADAAASAAAALAKAARR